jgi:hypothetical protein
VNAESGRRGCVLGRINRNDRMDGCDSGIFLFPLSLIFSGSKFSKTVKRAEAGGERVRERGKRKSQTAVRGGK